jgi:hypothetical protein
MLLFSVYDSVEAAWWEAVGTPTFRDEARGNIAALARLLDTYDRNDDSDRDQYHHSASDQATAPVVPPTSAAAAGARDACLDETARIYGQTGNWRMLEAEEMTAAARNPLLAQAVGRPLVTHFFLKKKRVSLNVFVFFLKKIGKVHGVLFDECAVLRELASSHFLFFFLLVFFFLLSLSHFSRFLPYLNMFMLCPSTPNVHAPILVARSPLPLLQLQLRPVVGIVSTCLQLRL